MTPKALRLYVVPARLRGTDDKGKIPCIVSRANGETEEYDSIRAALRDLRAEYPDMVAVDAGGFELDENSREGIWDIRGGRIGLVWEDAATAGEPGLGDDGSHAIAELLSMED